MNEDDIFRKWSITTAIPMAKPGPGPVCLDLLQSEMPEPDLLRAVQELDEGCFAVLLRGDLIMQRHGRVLFEQIISLFFQPAYYTLGTEPFIFFDRINPAAEGFIAELDQQVKAQGFPGFLYTTYDAGSVSQRMFLAKKIDAGPEVDYAAMLREWVYNDRLSKSAPIFLFQDYIELPLSSSDPAWAKLHSDHHELLKLTRLIFKAGTIIAGQESELSLHRINEANNSQYLEFQKQDLAKILDFYKNEYEVLPNWFKRVGHVLKVILGKRSFRSLYNDEVKKYQS